MSDFVDPLATEKSGEKAARWPMANNSLAPKMTFHNGVYLGVISTKAPGGKVLFAAVMKNPKVEDRTKEGAYQLFFAIEDTDDPKEAKLKKLMGPISEMKFVTVTPMNSTPIEKIDGFFLNGKISIQRRIQHQDKDYPYQLVSWLPIWPTKKIRELEEQDTPVTSGADIPF